MSSLEKELGEIQEALRDERNIVRRTTDKADTTLGNLRNKIADLEKRLLPEQVVGVIRSYRYSMEGVGDPGGLADMPTHQFELECADSVCLHICVGSDRWDRFIQISNGALREKLSKLTIKEAVEGVRILVNRDPSYGRYVPVRVLNGEMLAEDQDGQGLYVGDRVLINEGVNMALVGLDSIGRLEGRREDGVFGGGRQDEQYGGPLWLATPSEVVLVSS